MERLDKKCAKHDSKLEDIDKKMSNRIDILKENIRKKDDKDKEKIRELEERINVLEDVVLSEGFNPDEAMTNLLQEHVKATIAPFKYPRSIKFIKELPKTATGKVQRFRLGEKK